jgi:7tm Odorant receptor
VASSYSLVLVTTTYVGIDGLFVGCCFYVAAQFRIVRQNIADLFSQEMEDKAMLTAEQNDKIRERLVPIIKRHYQCIELTETLVETFAQILFTQFFMIAVILAMHSILMEMSDSIHEIMFYANCIAAGIFHMFLFCRSGSVLTDAVSF